MSAEELRQRADLLVSMGGDGTMLRAMRLADRQRFPVLGVNLGKLGFLAEVDVPDLPDALSAIDDHSYTTEPRLALDAVIGDRAITAFNDIAFVRFPGHKTADIAVRAAGHPFVSYAADAIVVATPTGSTAYSFSAGGPIVSPGMEALVVTPVAPHSAYNRGLVISREDQLGLDILPGSGRLAVEADGIASADVGPGDQIELISRPGAARVVRLGRTTFYQRARRKLRLTDSAEIPATFGDGEEIAEHATAVRDLPARPPRQRAALAPVAHRGELGRVPASPACARRARARRRLRPGHDHRGPGRPGAVRSGRRRSTRLPTCLTWRGRRPSRRGQANVRFETGDVYQLAFEDGTFDVVHAHQVLQHLSDPVAALAEMRRVCRPGGLVAARDGDYGGFFWFPSDPGLDEWQALYRDVARALGGEPDAGRHLLAWARAAGFSDVLASGSAWCYTGPDDRPWWGAVGAAADRIAVRGPGRRARPGHAGRPGAAGPGLAALGGQRGRLVPHPPRGDPLHRLTRLNS